MSMHFIFDMDGTLYQTEKILELALQDTFDQLRSLDLWDTETPIDLYREIMGVPLPIVWESLLPNHSIEVRQKSNEFFHDKLITNINLGKGALYPHVEETFNYIKSLNGSIYIASNGQTEYLESIVRYYNLDNWVTETFSIQQIHTQDKADLVKSIIKKYNITTGAVIGDRLSDINAAKQNGLLSIGCKFDYSQEDELNQADNVIDNFLDLKALINLLNQCANKA